MFHIDWLGALELYQHYLLVELGWIALTQQLNTQAIGALREV